MRIPQDIYRRLSFLMAVQLASVALIVLAMVVLVILQRRDARGRIGRMDELAERVTALEYGALDRPAGSTTIPFASPSKSVDGTAHAQPGFDSADEVIQLADSIGGDPSAAQLRRVLRAILRFESLGVSASKLDPIKAAAVAKLYLAAERFEAAAEWSEAAMASGARGATTSCMLARARYRLGQFAEARAAIEQCLEAGHTDPQIVLLQGRIELATDQTVEGEATLDKALAWDEVAADAAVDLVRRFLDRGDVQQAVRVLQRAEEVAPDRYDVLHCKAEVLLASQEFEQCIEVATMLLAVDAADRRMLRVFGEASLGAGQAEAAERTFRHLAVLRSDDPDSHVLLGRALLAQLRTTEAAEQFALAVRLSPGQRGRAGTRDRGI